MGVERTGFNRFEALGILGRNRVNRRYIGFEEPKVSEEAFVWQSQDFKELFSTVDRQNPHDRASSILLQFQGLRYSGACRLLSIGSMDRSEENPISVGGPKFAKLLLIWPSKA